MINLAIIKEKNLEFEKNSNYPNRRATDDASFSPCYDIPVADIVFNHVDNQPRPETKDVNHFEDTKCSILAKGLENPIVVSVDKNGVITLESGHHRTSAFQDLEIETIPAYIVTYNGSTEEDSYKMIITIFQLSKCLKRPVRNIFSNSRVLRCLSGWNRRRLKR